MKKVILPLLMIAFVMPAVAAPTIATEPWVRSALDTKPDMADVTTAITTALSGTIETDPTVPAWAKTASKPAYTAAEVGARPNTWVPSYNDLTDKPTGIVTETGTHAMTGTYNITGTITVPTQTLP